MATKSISQVQSSSVPRDARQAASQGFNLREGFFTFEDEFTDANKMVRKGTMELEDNGGQTIEIPFTATFTFGKPANK